MPSYPISQPADNAAAYTYTQPIRDAIAAANDHQTRISALESGTTSVIDPSASPYNAPGTAGSDSTTGLAAAIAALTTGDTLWIGPDKVYQHTTNVDLNAKGVYVTGGGEIRATVEANSAFRIYGDDALVENVKFTCPTTTVRGDTLTHQKLQLHGDGQTLRKVTVSGSAAAGIFTYGATNFVIENCYVTGTRADAYHCVKASSYGLIKDCHAYDVGDDGFAAVAYGTGVDAGQTHHLRFHNCKVINPVGATLNKGRCFGVAGATDVDFVRCYGEGSYAAGFIVVNETSYSSNSSARVRVDGMELRRANTLSGPSGSATRPDHGAVIISAELGTITDVKMRNVTVVDTDTGVATRNLSVLENGGTVSDIEFNGVYITGGPAQQFYTNITDSTKYRLIDVHGPGSWGWELLGGKKLTAAANSTGAITIPPRDELMIVVRINGSSGADIPALRFNGDTGANYWDRHITWAANGAATPTPANVQNVSTTMARLAGATGAGMRNFTAMIGNQPGWQKVGTISAATSTGGATAAGTLDNGAFEWANTTTQITSVTLLMAGGTVTMNTDCGILIFGRNLS